jgi:TonB family protein
MKNLRLLPLVAFLVLLAPVRARAAQVKIIANPSVSTDAISGRELKSVFLEEKNSLSDGSHVEPVLLKSGPVHESFLRQYLSRTDDDLRNYYRVLVFTGRGSMPKELGSDAEVVAYVAGRKGAIGYVSAEAGVDGVKTLAITDGRSPVERRVITRIEPEYPETLKRLNIGGIVRLQVTIAPKGNVENVQLLGGNPILGESAVAAVKQWVYATAPSRTRIEVSVPFNPQP